MRVMNPLRKNHLMMKLKKKMFLEKERERDTERNMVKVMENNMEKEEDLIMMESTEEDHIHTMMVSTVEDHTHVTMESMEDIMMESTEEDHTHTPVLIDSRKLRDSKDTKDNLTEN